jgi:DNA-binding response OmpR family regulator
MSQSLYNQAIDCCEHCGNPLERPSEVAHWGQLTLMDRTLTCLGRQTRISGQQATILRALMGRGAVSRDGLLMRIDKNGDGTEPNVLHVQLCRLRKKLRVVNAPCRIKSMPEFGFALEAIDPTDISARN